MNRRMQTVLLFAKIIAVGLFMVGLVIGGTALQAWLFWQMKP